MPQSSLISKDIKWMLAIIFGLVVMMFIDKLWYYFKGHSISGRIIHEISYL